MFTCTKPTSSLDEEFQVPLVRFEDSSLTFMPVLIPKALRDYGAKPKSLDSELCCKSQGSVPDSLPRSFLVDSASSELNNISSLSSQFLINLDGSDESKKSYRLLQALSLETPLFGVKDEADGCLSFRRCSSFVPQQTEKLPRSVRSMYKFQMGLINNSEARRHLDHITAPSEECVAVDCVCACSIACADLEDL